VADCLAALMLLLTALLALASLHFVMRSCLRGDAGRLLWPGPDLRQHRHPQYGRPRRVIAAIGRDNVGSMPY
jgi:hypothetical protein